MALATRCPHCGTSFRVAQDQLKLRAGLVRCGACKEIFNGAEHLLNQDGTPRAAGPLPIPSSPDVDTGQRTTASPLGDDSSTTPAQTPDSTLPAQSDHSQDASVAPPGLTGQPESLSATTTIPTTTSTTTTGLAKATGREPTERMARAVVTPQTQPANQDTQPDPLTRMTLMDFAGTGLPARSSDNPDSGKLENEPPDVLGQAMDELARKPWRSRPRRRDAEPDPIDAMDESGAEPEFLRKARRQEIFSRRFGLAMTLGTTLLALALLLQVAYAFRNQLAAMLPQSRPALVALCKLASCRIGLPAQIDAVSIETNELQAIADNPDGLLLTAMLRNRSALPQAWPSIELTLNDANDKPVARRVFGPRDYLGAEPAPGKGFPANTEQSVKLALSLNQLKPAGYRLYLFYP